MGILDNRHVELPRQKQDDQHRQHRHRQEIGDTAAPVEKWHNVRPRRDLRENIANPVEHDIRDKKSGNQEGQKFNRRFHANGEHQAMMMLAGVDMAGAEGGCEGGEDQSDKQSEVAECRTSRAHRAGIMCLEDGFDGG